MKYQVISEYQQDKSQTNNLMNAQYQLFEIENSGLHEIYTGAISNDLKYIVSGGNQCTLKIWDYNDHKLIHSIQVDNAIYICKFTNDSKLLYVGTYGNLYQFDATNEFKQTFIDNVHEQFINNLCCITNTIILTTSFDETIIKTDIDQKRQIFMIIAHTHFIRGLDYNKELKVIASGSDDQSIKLWNALDGSLIINQQNAHDKYVIQVLFNMNNNQLVSLDNENYIKIWIPNYGAKELEIKQQIEEKGYNLSLILEQQQIVILCNESIKVYTITGEFLRQFSHEIQNQSNNLLSLVQLYLIQYSYNHLEQLQLSEEVKYILLFLLDALLVCKINVSSDK